MSTNAQLTQEQRYQIYALMKAGHNQTETAEIVGVHKSTISREVRRNSGLRGYRPKQAHQLAVNRRHEKVPPRITPDDWHLIDHLLREEWSPEQISLWLKEAGRLSVSHEWIYQHIIQDNRCGGTLHRHLRCQKQRKKRYGSYERRGYIPRINETPHPKKEDLKSASQYGFGFNIRGYEAVTNNVDTYLKES